MKMTLLDKCVVGLFALLVIATTAALVLHFDMDAAISRFIPRSDIWKLVAVWLIVATLEQVHGVLKDIRDAVRRTDTRPTYDAESRRSLRSIERVLVAKLR
jgi:hypothetical protein